MSILKIFIVTVCAFTSLKIRAATQTIEEYETTALLNSLTVEELNRATETVSAFSILNRACEIQLQRQILPTQCYELSRFSAPLKVATARSVEELDKICLKIASETKETEITVLHTAVLPQECHLVALKKVQLNRYKAGMTID